MSKRILALDCSTTTVGIAVIDEDGPKTSLVHNTFYKPPKKGNIFERLASVRKFIISILEKYQPDEVVLEDIILFMPRKSSAKTITSLAIINRTIGLAVYDTLGKPPTLLSVMKIRHALKLTKELPSKEEIPELVAKILNIDFPYILNKKGNIAVENYDMADAVAVALAHAKLSNMPIKLQKRKLKNE